MYCQHNFAFNAACLQSWFNILTHRLHYIRPSVHTQVKRPGRATIFQAFFIPIVFLLLWGKLTLGTRATAHGEVKIGDGGKVCAEGVTEVL